MVDEIARKRADKSGDCREWSVLDCLEDTAEKLRRGEIKADQVVVVYSEQDDADGPRKMGYVAAGVTRSEQVALLRLVEFFMLRDWTYG